MVKFRYTLYNKYKELIINSNFIKFNDAISLNYSTELNEIDKRN